MKIEQIGDWTLEDRLAVSHEPVVVRFMETGEKGGASRRDFLRAAKVHPNARFYEVDLVENPSLAARYSIGKVPMVIVFIHGTEVARQAGDLVGTTVDRALNDSPDAATD